MNSDTVKKKNTCQCHLKVTQELYKLTLINKSFVLPMLVACCDKWMMTNRLLNQDFVLELLNVIVKDYLKVC